MKTEMSCILNQCFQKTTVRKLKIAKDEAERIEFVYSTARGEAKKTIAIKIKLQEAIEVKRHH
jgi:hypothetical protein